MFHRVKARLIKYLWLIILVPILTGCAGFLFESMHHPVYTGSVQIKLGHFATGGEEPYTNIDMAVTIISSPPFLQKAVAQGETAITPKELQKQLVIQKISKEVIALSLTGEQKQTVKMTLNGVVQEFMKESHAAYKGQASFIKQQISKMKQQKVSADSAYDKRKFIFDMQQKLKNMRQASVMEPLIIKGIQPNPAKRAIFGVMIGIIFDLIVLFLPELLRSDE